jgi:hypothetical protein
VRLLDRSRRGVEPTPYGRALIKRGIAIFDEMRQGIEEIEFLSDLQRGKCGSERPIRSMARSWHPSSTGSHGDIRGSERASYQALIDRRAILLALLLCSLVWGKESRARESNGSLIVTSTGLTIVHRGLISALAARHKLPAVYFQRIFVASGGLIS